MTTGTGWYIIVNAVGLQAPKHALSGAAQHDDKLVEFNMTQFHRHYTATRCIVFGQLFGNY
jgi:hypothetical protein